VLISYCSIRQNLESSVVVDCCAGVLGVFGCIVLCVVILPVCQNISQLPNKFMGILPHPRIYNLINSLISWVLLSNESYLSDTDNIVPFENTTPINQNKKVQIEERRAD